MLITFLFAFTRSKSKVVSFYKDHEAPYLSFENHFRQHETPHSIKVLLLFFFLVATKLLTYSYFLQVTASLNESALFWSISIFYSFLHVSSSKVAWPNFSWRTIIISISPIFETFFLSKLITGIIDRIKDMP